MRVTYEKEILYFDETGPQNTEEKRRAGQCRNIVVCSISGKTALQMAKSLKGFNVKIARVHA